ncbi:MAG: AAA family ATPase, partial [Candidatus Omnitrophica bacterium]|nr:AAA family ATPase [Candidatus Omnitrophota bacterium]
SLLNKLSYNTKVALITNTHLTSKELLASILEEFEVEITGLTKQKLLSRLNKYLITQLAEDSNVVLIIDEAQNLTFKVLEEIRMLSNLETEKEKLIQIILLGQPDLRLKLNNPKLEQFRQRIAVYYHINPLNRQETQDYILHRLRLVCENGYESIFSQEAIELIYDYSKGIPRVINLVCDSALLSGFIYNKKLITAQIVREVLRERDVSASWIEQPEQLNSAQESLQIQCCCQCIHYYNCELKWIRGKKNERQICCNSCVQFLHCNSDSVVKTKL